MRTFSAFLLASLLLASPPKLVGQEQPAGQEKPAGRETAESPEPSSVSKLVESVKPSIVEITTDHVGGSRRGVGAGFVLSADGLIATNLHVIGEGKEIRVETTAGRKLTVREIHASDRFLDLAVLRVDVGDTPLKPLALGGTDNPLGDGADIVVIGNPHGLRNSVVRGVVSARRDIDGRPMLQIAIPIEPGNSGGPVIDLKGRVHGVVTMKSAVTDNLGFAVTVESLQELLKTPNPVSYDNWRSIGRIDEREWKPLFGADWRQLGGRILVRQPGKGFGGRSLLLRASPASKDAFELGAMVKLDDESGAAGLVFHADGKNRHYGFYPSGGRLRFTCFEGPTVFNWRILHNAPSEHYRSGEFNHLKVRVEEGVIRCYVNHELVFETEDDALKPGQVGLAKFRQTGAEFRQFEFGDEISAKSAPSELIAKVESQIRQINGLEQLRSHQLDNLAENDRVSIELIEEEAEKLQRRSAELRKLAKEVHARAVIAKIKQLIQVGAEFDVLELSLLIAQLDDPTVDVNAYLRLVDRMGETIRGRLEEDASDQQRIEALNHFLYRENGYHGSRAEYYHPAKRYMNRVLDDRNGIPVMLAILYIALGERIGLELEGVGLPGHFVVRAKSAEKDQLIDVFDSGKAVDRDRAAELVADTTGGEFRDDFLAAATPQQIGVRMMMNLGSLANEKRDLEALHRYLSATLAIDSKLAQARLDRARVRALTGRKQLAIDDLRILIEASPDGLDLNRIQEMRDYLESQP